MQNKVFRRDVFACLCLTIVTVGVYWNVQRFPFVAYDDPNYVYKNRHVHEGLNRENIQWAFTSGEHSNWHPVTWLSHMLDCHLFGLDRPGCHHLVNLAWHVINTWLTFFLFRRMTGCFWQPVLVAAFFALHPVHVESVAWVSERKDVLSTFFWLALTFSYTEYSFQGDRRWYGLALLFLMLGLMAKPMLVTAPFLLLLLDYWPLKRVGSIVSRREDMVAMWKKRIMEKIPMFVIIAISSVITYAVQEGSGAVWHQPLWHRLCNALVAYARYIGKVFWPTDLALLYPNHVGMWKAWHVVTALMVLCLISTWTAILWKKRYLTVGWLWFLGTLVPVIGVVQVGGHSMADRYLYMPMTGLLIMIAWGLGDLSKHGWPGRGGVVVISAGALATCLWLTPPQVSLWVNSHTLFAHALDVTERNYVMHNNLGNVYSEQGNLGQAISQYRQALEINPNHATTHNNLGLQFQETGRVDDAVHHFRQAVRIHPQYDEAHHNLGTALMLQRRYEEAITHFQASLLIRPDNVMTHHNLANVLREIGQLEKAVVHHRKVLSLQPNHAEAHNNLGIELQKLGQGDAAVSHFQHALRIEPRYGQAHNNLGMALHSRGKIDGAIKHYRQALQSNPQDPFAHNNLGIALFTENKFDQAIEHFREALRLNPNHPSVRDNLNRAIRKANEGSESNGK